MKLTGIVLLLGAIQISASAYSQKITLSEKNASLERVFRKIMKQSEYMFLYKDEVINSSKNVTIEARSLPIEQVLANCFEDQPITYQVVDKTVIVRLKPPLSEKQELLPPVKVTGKVLDEKGQTLPGASVMLKGTSLTVASDANGNFSITIPEENLSGAVLVVTFLGYQRQSVSVGNNRELTVKLDPMPSNLGEVVVIGYGTQKRGNVTGAVATLHNDNLEERAINRVDQALVGQLAGVNVKQTTGVPGKAFSIQVRGSGSISGGNEPLYVIDGFPLSVNSSNAANGSFATGNPLDNINPNDIETVQVLKDAAAAAIYGSRASNGVVLITTKRGKNGAPRINFNSYLGYNEAAKKLEMMNGDQWIANAVEVINAQYIAKYGSVGASVNDDQATRVARNGGVLDANYVPDARWFVPGHPGLSYIDWQDAIMQKGLVQNYGVSASGGTEAVNYFLSGNYANQEGFVKHVGYTAYSLRANLEVKASEHLKFGVNIAPTYSVTQDPGVEGQNSIFHQALSLAPVQEASAGLFPNFGNNAQYTYSSTTNSPYGKLQYIKGTTKRYRTLATLYGQLQVTRDLAFRSSVNLDNTDNNANTYVPYVSAGTLAARTFTGSNNLLAATSGTFNAYRRQTFVNENTLTYDHTFKEKHSLNVLAGFSYNRDRFDRVTESSNGGFTSAVIQTLNAAAAVTGSTTSSQSVLLSYFSRVQYGYDEKYLFSASVRRDGSSRFGINNQYGVFPSASVKWVASKENFMQSLTALSDLSLRASYGVNGNNNLPNDYASIATIGNANYVFGTTQAAAIGQTPNVLANPDLKWERSQTYDLGLDFGLFNNRLTGSFDYYNKLNTDLLLNVQVPEATGFQTYLTNIGSVRNKGQEIELNSRNLTGSFQWSTSLNLTHNSNKIEALGPGQKQIIVPNGNNVADQILRVGSPLNSIYVLKVVGFLTADDIAKGVARYGSGQAEGDFKFEDYNNDGSITEADKQIMGHPNPDYTFGITNTFKYKGFDLNVLVQGQHGGSIYSELGRALTRPGQGRSDNHPASFEQRWKSPTDQGEGRFSKTYATYNSPIAAASDWLYSSDYIRVRNITLGYDLKGLLKTRFVNGARMYMTAENFFGHDKYVNGLNPEAANTSISSNSAFPEAGDYGGLPLAKSLIFGLNFTF